MKWKGKPTTFTVSGDRFIVYYGKVELNFPKELYEKEFDGDYQVVHKWLRQSRIEFNILSELGEKSED